ncbi:MAG: FAD-binding oxidoreductase [Pseudomonadota bacterium]
MKRRTFLSSLAGAAGLLMLNPALAAKAMFRRVRPGDKNWPSLAAWRQLRDAVGGNLVEVASPLAGCNKQAAGAACAGAMDALKNPYYIRDSVALTQSLGWADAWTTQPSRYAVACSNTQDVVAAVNFAREHKLRLVVKGGGHSYQGSSNAPDSLLIWTRHMDKIVMHDGFVGQGCAGTQAPSPAVTVDAGAIWMHTYNAVTTKGGRYVQGGGCATVGVAGLIQSGGFGSFSKNYGMASASLLEAEIVTADGVVRIANACANPELFWALKGGGGGSLGVVTKVTLRTHALPEHFGVVRFEVFAKSDDAYRRLIDQILAYYSANLFNPHWGEKLVFETGNTLSVDMLFQGLDKEQATAAWQGFLDWLKEYPADFSLNAAPLVLAVPARKLWDPAFLKMLPGVTLADGRPGAPPENLFWSDNVQEAGQFLQGYQSTWVPASLLEAGRRKLLANALFTATRSWEVALHLNKGLAGAPAEAITAARDTATNPVLLESFALAICAGEQELRHPHVAGYEPDMAKAREAGRAITRATQALRAVVPNVGSYVSESDYFEKNWQSAFWGTNYPRLLAAKQKYDRDGLFFVRHGVGSEAWSEDGFTKLR